MSSTGYPKVYEVGDTATYQGTAHQILDVSQNNKAQCPCRGWCARLELDGAGYVRACQVQPADDDMAADLRNVLDVEAGLAAIVPAAAAAAAAAAAPLDRSRTAGPYRVRIYVTDADQTVRVEVTHSGGGLVRVDTRDGLADMTARFGLADADAAKVVANDTVTLLRAGLSPRAVASLAFGISA